MSQTQFIQISTLTSYPAVLLNRDDSGMAKRMPFGGALRTRVSSQCLKKHWREAAGEHSLCVPGEDLANAVRSREIYSRLIAPEVVKLGVSKELAEASLVGVQNALYGEAKKQTKKKQKAQDTEEFATLKRSEVIVLGRPEIQFIVELAGKACQEADGDASKAQKLAQDMLKKRKPEMLALRQGMGVDAAMFGRFVSGDPEARVNAAVHVAHALTVHEQNSETDYFSAVDDLTTAEHAGSGHLGASELTSGLFYTYAVVDLPTLVKNLVAVDPPPLTPDDWALAGRLVGNFINLMATVSPGAKLGSTAPYDYAKLVLVEAGSRQPRTLANAFLDPLRLDGPDMLGRAQQALVDYVSAVDSMYGQGEQRWQAGILPQPLASGAVALNLPELTEAVRDMVASAGEEQ
jgi:CRISPR system Cascade subunit CasC